MARSPTDVAVIIPDASPVLTLARIGRLDLLATFSVPIRIVDQVYYEITKRENDPNEAVAVGLERLRSLESRPSVKYDGMAAHAPSRRSSAGRFGIGGTDQCHQKDDNGAFREGRIDQANSFHMAATELR